jgi:hypothetical protein
VAESLGYLLAQSFNIASTLTFTTTDSRGGPTNRTLAAGWYRVKLAASGAGGTAHTDPKELLAAVQTALGGSSYWTVQLTVSGKVRVTYKSTGTGTITLSGATTLRSLLGFTGNVTSLATNAYVDSDYQPTHCVFAAFMDPDTGWIDQPQRYAASAMPDGTVYGWHDGRATLRRTAAFKLLPKDSATVGSLSSTSTPAFPAASRWLSPSTGEPGQAPPWSAHDAIVTAHALECGMVWGTLQEVIAGTSTSFEKVYLTPEMATASRIALSIPGYDARRDVSVELSYAGAGSL